MQVGIADWANSKSYADEAYARGITVISRQEVAVKGIDAWRRRAERLLRRRLVLVRAEYDRVADEAVVADAAADADEAALDPRSRLIMLSLIRTRPTPCWARSRKRIDELVCITGRKDWAWTLPSI